MLCSDCGRAFKWPLTDRVGNTQSTRTPSRLDLHLLHFPSSNGPLVLASSQDAIEHTTRSWRLLDFLAQQSPVGVICPFSRSKATVTHPGENL